MFTASALSPQFILVCFAVCGLCVGSFLNVVIYRLPKMLQARFADATEEAAASLSLSRPRSSCRHCGHLIRWYENIPLLSFVFLRGRCAACQQPIGWRYPLVELVTAALFTYTAWRWGLSLSAIAYALWAAALLALALMDWDTTYLPDDITLPLVWSGLLMAALDVLPGISLHHALFGAVLGYASLWVVFWGFKLFTGRDGMGYGDFKLLAAIGAWLGVQALIPVMLIAASSGALVGVWLRMTQRDHQVDGVGGYIPFGPFLAGGALLEWMTGWQL